MMIARVVGDTPPVRVLPDVCIGVVVRGVMGVSGVAIGLVVVIPQFLLATQGLSTTPILMIICTVEVVQVLTPTGVTPIG